MAPTNVFNSEMDLKFAEEGPESIYDFLSEMRENMPAEEVPLLRWMLLHRNVSLQQFPQWLKEEFSRHNLLHVGKERSDSFKSGAYGTQLMELMR